MAGGQFFRDDSGHWSETGHVFIGAKSNADAVRVMREAGFILFTRNELDVYFSKGCWGNSMDGIEPERGVWAMPCRLLCDIGITPTRYR